MKLTVEKLKSDLKKGKDINIYISDRGGRKSSAVQDFLIENNIKTGECFCVMRSKSDEQITDLWFSEYVRKKYNKMGYYFESDKIGKNVAVVYICNKNDNTKNVLLFGLWISLAEKYKSSYIDGFEKIKYFVWEECVPNERIYQKIVYVLEKFCQPLKNVISIGSTVARTNKHQFIFLGNDIPENIINPVTVTFNLLERLKFDTDIFDTVKINNKQYSFMFSYFSVDEKTIPHWCINYDFDVANNLSVKGKKKFNFILISEYNRYYVYKFDNFLYISSQKTESEQERVFESAVDFFDFYGAKHLLENYQIEIALLLLQTLYQVPQKEIDKYFNLKYEFSPIVNKNPDDIINIYELSKMNMAEISLANNFDEIIILRNILKENKIIFENLAIKTQINDLITKIYIL